MQDPWTDAFYTAVQISKPAAGDDDNGDGGLTRVLSQKRTS